MKTQELYTVSTKELEEAAEAAEELGMDHPMCKNGHGMMLFFEGDYEMINSYQGFYLVDPKFYCAHPECLEEVVIK